MSLTTSPLPRAVECILSRLPLHAEEGTLRESLAESDLLVALGMAGVVSEASALLVATLRRQLEALTLLDRVELSQGRWSFVSFPASLLGRSLLETLATPGQAILPLDYWNQGDHRPQAIKEEQRRLLHRIESERVRSNSAARPIRVVHVAWAVIRLRDKYLLHRREDMDRPGEKTHVLPGGRFNTSDLPTAELATGADVLRQMCDVASPLVGRYLDNTLTRELAEELSLLHGEDYLFDRWQRLAPYREVAGAGNRHAYSEYGFQLYTLKLTAAGEVRLLDREAESETLTWFSASELAAPQRSDGATAFVDVLHAAWGEDVAGQLATVSDSGATGYALDGESNTLDLPVSSDAGIQIGKPGKERILPLAMEDAEWQLLLLLGWHARDFVIHAIVDVRLLGGGWVRVADSVARTTGRNLIAKMERLSLPLVEMRDGHYLRLNIDPQCLMIGAALFTYRVEGSNADGGVLTVTRDEVTTVWGKLLGDTTRVSINGNTISILRELQRGDEPKDLPGMKADSWERNLREQLKSLKLLGLRRFWTTKNNVSSLVDGIRVLR